VTAGVVSVLDLSIPWDPAELALCGLELGVENGEDDGFPFWDSQYLERRLQLFLSFKVLHYCAACRPLLSHPFPMPFSTA
jgi:hypothetical protein